MDEMIYDLPAAKRVFSRVGLSLTAILAIGLALSFVISFLVSVSGNVAFFQESWFMWMASFLPLYGIAIPLGLLVMKKLPAEAPEERKLGAGNGFVFFLICVFLMYTGNIIGTMLSMILSGGTAVNGVAELVQDNHPLKVLFVVVLAPVLEELVFRKQLLDRTRRYGERAAAMLSAVTFGLLHMNLYQFFYAFALGLVFAYIYLRTGRLRYTAILHAVINFMGSVVAPWVLEIANADALASLDPTMPTEEMLGFYMDVLPGMLAVLGYSLVLIGFFIAGLVLFIIKVRRLVWKAGSEQLPEKTAFRTIYCNGGMIAFMVFCLVMIVFNLI